MTLDWIPICMLSYSYLQLVYVANNQDMYSPILQRTLDYWQWKSHGFSCKYFINSVVSICIVRRKKKYRSESWAAKNDIYHRLIKNSVASIDTFDRCVSGVWHVWSHLIYIIFSNYYQCDMFVSCLMSVYVSVLYRS